MERKWFNIVHCNESRIPGLHCISLFVLWIHVQSSWYSWLAHENFHPRKIIVHNASLHIFGGIIRWISDWIIYPTEIQSRTKQLFFYLKIRRDGSIGWRPFSICNFYFIWASRDSHWKRITCMNFGRNWKKWILLVSFTLCGKKP